MASLSDPIRQAVRQHIAQHQLPPEFFATVETFYLPLAEGLANSTVDGKCFLLGVQGSQGSGKSTCADFLKLLLTEVFGKRVLVASIDDFYLTRAERQVLSDTVHPLFITRGVPGTHAVTMIQQMFDNAAGDQAFRVPVFDKSIDDRAPQDQWQQVQGPFDVVILEGWCVGIGPQTPEALQEPINELERQDDPDGVWRAYVNNASASDYADLYARLDALVALQAPSFDCVYGWRLLQEQKMIARLVLEGRDASQAQTPAQIERFISHYQRLTEHALATMPAQADWLLELNAQHGFKSLRGPQ
ncbi:kinase [Arenicella chitinivorans]|uniref:Kinase n=1 Tax=Arenicella chitinivorans TaxID=1329800 RepID=A0A918RUQ1_9GAMM|nr:phosphoribulokinase [Arenicella chitinivorans]GHA09312.1 kinase [Arenicella chitinivorans]